VAFSINPPAQPTYASISRPAPRHNDGCNMGFLDGHAKWTNIGGMKGGIIGQAWGIKSIYIFSGGIIAISTAISWLK